MTDSRQPTLHDRLRQLPPFLVFNLARVPNPPQTKEELRQRLWNRQARRERWLRKLHGNPAPRRPRYLPMTTEELAKRTGLKEYWVRFLRNRMSWDDVPVDKMLRFLEGCGIEICHRGGTKRANSMQYRTKHKLIFAHLDKKQMQRFLVLLAAWRAKLRNEVP